MEARLSNGLYKFKTAPRAHQFCCLVNEWGKPAWGRFHQMRTGKTPLTVYEMDALVQFRMASRFLVVCPKRMIGVWKEMLHEHSHTDWGIYTEVGACMNKASIMRPHVLLVNYERTWVRKNGRVLAHPEIVDWAPEYIVLDEGHKIKNRTAARSRGLYLLGSIAKWRRVLTGTPDPNSYADYYGIFKFLDPTIFGTWTEFSREHLLLDWFNRVVGYRNLDALTAKIHSISSRVLKSEVGEIPEEEDIVQEVVLPARAKKVYDSMATQMFAELEGGSASAPIVLTKLLRLAQVTGGFVTRDDGEVEWLHDAKMDLLLETLEEVLSDGGAKAVVFFRFRPELARAAEALRRAHIGFCELHGDTENDSAIRESFRSDPKCRVLLAQIASGSLGLDFSTAQTAIYYSLDFDAATYEQARARIWKQGGNLTHIHLIVPQSIDGTMLKVVKNKMKRSANLLDNYWRLVRGEAAA